MGLFYTVGTVPPSIVSSAPVIEEARSEDRKATRLAILAGLEGRPRGIPPRESIMMFMPPQLGESVRFSAS
ncbi:hypothetical protein X737_03665 [Mesorhizobium sp. L48C026A00]|nr:hypothetical protein X737_03665 [Mesorhizobium sp. L48C026A00]